MNSPFICCMLAAAISFSCKAQDENSTTIYSKWQTKTLNIDGDPSDWDDSLTLEDEKTNIRYAISNDASTLFIRIRTNNEFAQTKILCAGLKTTINAQGKKKPSATVSFPMQLPTEDMPAGRSADLRAMRLTGFLKAKTYELSGFKKADGQYPAGANNAYGIRVQLAFYGNAELVYEAAIPFSSFLHEGNLSQGDSSVTIAVGFLINGMQKPGNNASLAPPNDAGAGAGGRGAGRRGGGNGNRNSAHPPAVRAQAPENSGFAKRLYDSGKTWQLVHLAVHT